MRASWAMANHAVIAAADERIVGYRGDPGGGLAPSEKAREGTAAFQAKRKPVWHRQAGE